MKNIGVSYSTIYKYFCIGPQKEMEMRVIHRIMTFQISRLYADRRDDILESDIQVV